MGGLINCPSDASSDLMPHSQTLDKSMKFPSSQLPSLLAYIASGQVNFPCYTPIISHFLTINPSKIHCQVIIYTEASQPEADPTILSFHQCSGWVESIWLRGERSCTSGISCRAIPSASLFLLSDKVIAVSKITQAFSFEARERE